mmetsp:Transcript_37639/g.97107  ORF Transcript_37639/g.97107 Transcript_37639/m.97107 type:complete len:281 (+) Transcript_37639:413-1255(+)
MGLWAVWRYHRVDLTFHSLADVVKERVCVQLRCSRPVLCLSFKHLFEKALLQISELLIFSSTHFQHLLEIVLSAFLVHPCHVIVRVGATCFTHYVNSVKSGEHSTTDTPYICFERVIPLAQGLWGLKHLRADVRGSFRTAGSTAKICKLNYGRATIRYGYQHIFRLNITMSDPLFMKEHNAFDHLIAKAKNALHGRWRSPLAKMLECTSRSSHSRSHVLGKQVLGTILNISMVVKKSHYVDMLVLHQHLYLHFNSLIVLSIKFALIILLHCEFTPIRIFY